MLIISFFYLQLLVALLFLALDFAFVLALDLALFLLLAFFA
jgi:hypothetical protein